MITHNLKNACARSQSRYAGEPLKESIIALSAIVLIGCENQPLMSPVVKDPSASAQNPAGYGPIPISVNHSGSSPKRLSAEIAEEAYISSKNNGYCWLFYSTEDGKKYYLLNPNSEKKSDRTIIGIVDRHDKNGRVLWQHTGEVDSEKSELKVLFRLQGNSLSPLIDGVFLARINDACKITSEPKVSFYYQGNDPEIVVVPLSSDK